LNLGVFGNISFDWAFVSALFSIVIIDLILAGDNAVVIAMAVRSLPSSQRRRGILVGAGAAVVLRVLATFFVSQMLRIQFIKLVGGALILWIAVKLFVEGAPEEGLDREATNLWQAVRIIVIADITMSLDNMLAVAGVSQGNLFLLLFGLGLSIPFVVLTSNLLAMLMDKYPIIIYLGAAILGRVGGEMMITDPVMESWLHPNKVVVYAVEALFAVGVIVVGKIWVRQMIKAERDRNAVPDATEVTPPEHKVD
jgi:YjbE family integral membrane protein